MKIKFRCELICYIDHYINFTEIFFIQIIKNCIETSEFVFRLRILPRMLRDVTTVDITTTVLGEKMSMPLGIAPTSLHKLAHPDGEVATAKGIN